MSENSIVPFNFRFRGMFGLSWVSGVKSSCPVEVLRFRHSIRFQDIEAQGFT